MKKDKRIDEYISQFPKETQVILRKLRKTIQSATPDADETMKYGIPTYVLDGSNLVHFGGFEKHVSLFPGGLSGITAFKKELKNFKTSKGTIKFPIEEPIPYALIAKIVQFRAKENSSH